jgi:F-type H+-transporting ATPase subunit gamma
MCGSLNEQIVSFALQTLKDRGRDAASTVLMAVGERVPGLFEDSGHPVETVMSLPASVAGITAAVQDILLKIDDWHETAGIGQVTLFYSRQLPGMACQPHALALLPVDPEAIGTGEKTKWPGRGLPAYTMDWAPCFRR